MVKVMDMFAVLQIAMVIVEVAMVIQIDHWEVVMWQVLQFRMFPTQDFIQVVKVEESIEQVQLRLAIEQVVQFIMLALVGQVHY